MQRRSVFKLLAGLALPGTSAFAQSSSGKTIRIVVPLSVGTGTDTVTRLIAPKLSAILGQPVIVDNKVGGNGLIGVQEVLRATPDGTTLLMGSVSSLAINTAMMKNPPYDPRRDFTAIAGAYTANHVWLVRPNFPARTFGEFITYMQKNPGKVNIGQASTLVKIQLAALQKMAGVEFVEVPYKTLGPTITDVISGVLDMTLIDTGAALTQVKSGQLRALAVSSPKRNPFAPDWPAVAETIPGFDFTSWTAMVGPAGMPRDVVARINAAMVQVIKQPDMLQRLEQIANVPMVVTPDELKSFMDAEVVKWTRVVKDAKIEQE